MNLQGYLLGNPVTDVHDDQNSAIPYAHRVSLISDEIYESTKQSCYGEYMNIDPNNAACLYYLQIVSKRLKEQHGWTQAARK
ncbi:serine carboxypeptidase-like 18 [Camellia sinensis]|uniref:serine carboxypeptidase-like 18 n=1 Tax=Camellia sinensis TaxID=4442 RepID=UPI0010360641|nr:serine carboxypeptidase-like 18 [Camellia sinensis]XP_028072261.1 serine carboxypeptidase-like 18 [Camellia sinensis]